MRPRDHQSAGFSLVELLVVIALVGVLAGMVLTSSSPSFRDRLEAAADQIVGDLGYARSLAVANGSTYRLTFDLARNQYVLTHVGTNAALNTLPSNPYHLRSDSATQQTWRLADLPGVGPPVRLHAVYAVGSTTPAVTTIDFGPLGETTRAEETLIWLASGVGSAARYMSVRVIPITGLCWIENYQASAPVAPAAGS